MRRNIYTLGLRWLSIPFNFLAVLFIVLRSKFSGNFAVEDGKFGFELLQFVLFAP